MSVVASERLRSHNLLEYLFGGRWQDSGLQTVEQRRICSQSLCRRLRERNGVENLLCVSMLRLILHNVGYTSPVTLHTHVCTMVPLLLIHNSYHIQINYAWYPCFLYASCIHVKVEHYVSFSSTRDMHQFLHGTHCISFVANDFRCENMVLISTWYVHPWLLAQLLHAWAILSIRF